MRRALLLAFGLVCVTPAEAWAYKCKVSEDYSFISLRWNTRVLKYAVRLPGSRQLTGEQVVRAVREAFAAWTVPGCTDLSFDERDPIEESLYDANGDGKPDEAYRDLNTVHFVRSAWPYQPDAVALTRTTYGTEDGVIRVATIDVNETFNFTDAAASCDRGTGTYDITAVLTHEVGHLIGLDHTQPSNYSGAPSDPTMAPTVSECETEKRTLETDDIQGLCLLYPKAEPSGFCSSLPGQAEPYVTNTAFGCTVAPRGEVAGLLLVLGLLFLRRRGLVGLP